MASDAHQKDVRDDRLATAQEREAATREILDVISRSRDDEKPVFDVILKNASRLCDAPLAFLPMASEDGKRVTAPAFLGVSDDFAEVLKAFDVPIEGSPLIAARAIAEARVICIDDLLADGDLPSDNRWRREMLDTEGVRSVLVVPLLRGDRALGAILLYRREVRPFSDEDVRLIETFAAQAVIAIENVRQFRELQTRLEREKASGEVLDVISRSRDDDQPVFDVILENACRLCETPLASIIMGRAGDAAQVIAAQRGADADTLEMYSGSPPPMDADASIAARAILEERVIHLEDMKDTEYYRDDRPHVRFMVDKARIRSVIFVPLISATGAIGAMILFRREVRPFTEEQVALISSFAAQAVIAIENVRQFRELQTRLEREAASKDILAVISQSRDDEQPVFDTILDNALRLCSAPFGFLMLADRAHELLRIAAYRGTQAPIVDVLRENPLPLDPERIDMARVVLEARVDHQPDFRDSWQYRDGDPFRRRAVDEEGIRTFVGIPLVLDGVGIGLIALYRREVKPFTDDEIALVETFAAQAVIAIENVRQFREVQERLEREKASGEVLEVISRSRDDEGPVFQVILENAARLCRSPMARLHLVDDARKIHRMAAVWGEKTSELVVGQEWSLADDLPIANAINRGETLAVDNFADTQLYRDSNEVIRHLVDVEGFHSLAVVPLLKDGLAIGCISLTRREVAPYAPDDLALVETFAAQAVIAIENVRQFREVQERLERERASAEVLEVISRSRDDDGPVFDVVLRNARRLCGATTAALLLGRPDDSHVTLMALDHADPDLNARAPETIAELNRNPMDMDPKVHASAQAICSGDVVHIPDLAETESYRNGEPSFRVMVDVNGNRASLSVPLLDATGPIGAINLHRQEPGLFTADQVALMQSFAAQAVIAIENVRQFREVQARLQREVATKNILSVISETRDDEGPVFEAILQNAARLCDAPAARLNLASDDRTQFRVAYAWGDMPVATSVGDAYPLDLPLYVPTTIREGRSFHIPDLADTDLYREGEPNRKRMVDEDGWRTFLTIPLLRDGLALGCIILSRREVKPFTPDQIALVETFAAQAVIAIENVRQFKALEALNAELGDRVEEQVGEIERMGRLKRFLPSAVADAVVSAGGEGMLSSHRSLLGILFCDIRGFTAFCERAEPEETIEILQTYHEEMGRLIAEHGAGVDHRMGDGIMVLFNDPLPCDEPAGDAVRLALAMRARMAELCKGWKRLGHRLGFGVGVALGYATVGMVGAAGRYEYTASGTAVNLASRLCDRAEDGEILLSPRAHIATEDDFDAERVGEITLKGLTEPLDVYRVTGVSAEG